ncbi:MAG: PTS mannitol transporter subunit IICBA [Megasphaera sp.]|jgi:PTS system mannitol-specific IIC component|nr:PTS mannitol transporter subunit IICBA [Megasphaera sp.]MCH4188348.1 PTS mannitol transporter subunit IICBA [Megasphaera sp.]MCH4218145.1 PTS mannitol transporter subunit IICBA [Megasphaera sp.]
MKTQIQSFGRFLSGMVMPNIGAFIAWGLITALFIPSGWLPNEQLAKMVGPFLTYVLPLLIAYMGGKMVAGDRGAVIGAITTVGVICGTTYTMFMGAMIAGPLAGYIIKKFDQAVDGHIKPGFEMLVNNFSIGIIGMILAIIGFYGIGPIMGIILSFLTAGVQLLINMGIFPLIGLFVEPAKVLFLNNAINHGIFTPLGAEQVATAGKSIFYMIETNPGPGTGVLLAYWLFSKDKATKQSAPGALIIHLLGGIHEISFPYILMNPALLLATMSGSVSALFYYSIMDLGLSGPPAPGSLIAYIAMAPKGTTLLAIFGIFIAAAVSFVIASIIIKMSNKKDTTLEDAQDQMKNMKAASKGQAAPQTTVIDMSTIKHIIFACDAGMGSSAMGAAVIKKKLKKAGLTDITVDHASVSDVPPDAQVVVCHQDLADRAKQSAPQARLITIDNFMAAPQYDELINELRDARQ